MVCYILAAFCAEILAATNDGHKNFMSPWKGGSKRVVVSSIFKWT